MARNDFNGDGLSDILWLYRENIEVSNWLGRPDGSFTVNDGAAFNWLNVMHTFDLVTAGDFNGDGRTDLLWRVDNDGYYINAMNSAGGFAIGAPGPWFSVDDPGWSIVGTADFNGDGIDDLLWRNSAGTISNWLGSSSGAFQINDAQAMKHVGNDWKIAGTGDFNGDGRDDILWLSDDGMMSNWLGTENGGFMINDHNALHRVSDWIDVDQIAIGDFNSDGLDDLLIVTPKGDAYISRTYADGAFMPAWGLGFVSKTSANGELTAVGDFNGDNVDDVLWRAGTTVSAWFGQSGTDYHAMTKYDAIADVPTDWQIAMGGGFVV